MSGQPHRPHRLLQRYDQAKVELETTLQENTWQSLRKTYFLWEGKGRGKGQCSVKRFYIHSQTHTNVNKSGLSLMRKG